MPKSSEQLDNKNTLRNRLLTAGSVLAVGSIALTGCGEKDATATPAPTETSTSVEQTPIDNSELLEDPQAYLTEKILNREKLTQEEYDAALSVYAETDLPPEAEEFITESGTQLIQGFIVPGNAEKVNWVYGEQKEARQQEVVTFGDQFADSLNTLTLPDELKEVGALLELARETYGFSIVKEARENNVDLNMLNTEFIPENGYVDVYAKENLSYDITSGIIEDLKSKINLQSDSMESFISIGLQARFTAESLGEEPIHEFDVTVDPGMQILDESMGQGLNYAAREVTMSMTRADTGKPFEHTFAQIGTKVNSKGNTQIVSIIE